MKEWIDRFLGFVPPLTTFFTAFGLFFFVLIFQSLIKWLENKLALPWMKEENQKQRKNISQGQPASKR